MLLQPDLGSCDQTVGEREQPALAIAMPAAIDGDGFQAEIENGEMRRSRDAGLTQQRLASNRRRIPPRDPRLCRQVRPAARALGKCPNSGVRPLAGTRAPLLTRRAFLASVAAPLALATAPNDEQQSPQLREPHHTK